MKQADKSGFSLVEMAVVLVIVGLLLGGLMVPLSTQMEQQKYSETKKVLETARDALVMYAAANGRLPCPASSSSNGAESFVPTTGNASNGACSNFNDGFLPAVTLGMHPVDAQGYAIDGWNTSANRIRYAVSSNTVGGISNPLTTQNGIRNAQITSFSGVTLLSICRSNSSLADCGGSTNQLSTQAPFVVISLGKNAPYGGTGLDEAQNLDTNSVFVSHEYAGKSAANGEFDDTLVWVSPSTLFARMLAAGSLP